MIRIKIRARLHKGNAPEDKAYVFLSSAPKTYKGDFLNSMFSLPKSQIKVIEMNEFISDHYEAIIDVPKWLYKKKLPLDDNWKKLITTLEVEKK